MARYYRGTKDSYGFGSYFTEHDREACYYADWTGGKAYEAEILPKRPYKSRGAVLPDVAEEFGIEYSPEARPNIMRTVHERGYDSIIMGPWLVVLDKSIVKGFRQISCEGRVGRE